MRHADDQRSREDQRRHGEQRRAEPDDEDVHKGSLLGHTLSQGMDNGVVSVGDRGEEREREREK